MTVDELYLDNIDEFVNDDNRIVTYKWLSASLQVHCNIAKQMLYTFLQKKKADEFTVTYFISGLSKPGKDGEQMFKCAVVPKDKLPQYKDSLTTVTSCHVYSVQKSKLKDSNALYMTDYEKFKENVENCSKHSSIRYDQAVARTRDEMDLLTLNVMPSMDTEKKPAATKVTAKPAGKKQATSALASMFAKADQTKKATKEANVKKEVKEEKKETDKKSPAKDAKKAGGMMSFFKPTGTKSSEVSDGKTSNNTKKKSSPKKTSQKTSPVAKKKDARLQDSDDEDAVPVSKRRRVKRDLLDSSSEEEEMDDDSPIPPTPPREPSPAAEPETRSDSPVVVEDEDPIPDKSSPAKESAKGGNAASAKTGERKRRRKRVQRTKNYMKDGFMVTEKVWESDSTDASEVEEPIKKAAKVPEKTKSPAKGKKTSPQKSPGKKGAAKGAKQTSLMSFFKKA